MLQTPEKQVKQLESIGRNISGLVAEYAARVLRDSKEKVTRRKSIKKITPGLVVKYSVRAEKGTYGDFEGFPFDRFGSWAVQATIIDCDEKGSRAFFEVFPGDDHDHERPLMIVDGIILPRPTGSHCPKEHYGSHPFQKGFATNIEPISVDNLCPRRPSLAAGDHPSIGNQLLIPARNINPGSLRIVRRVEAR